jgi:hypothetical protein
LQAMQLANKWLSANAVSKLTALSVDKMDE